MKKLMTMLAAVATAFGLYAADSGFISGAGFDTSDSSGYTWTTSGTLAEGVFNFSYWGADTTSLTVVSGKPILDDSDNRPAKYYDDANRNYNGYLNISTTLGSPVGQYVNANGDVQIIDNGLYFDALVKPTVFDEMPAMTAYENAKIGVFVYQADEDANKKLFVYAGGSTTNFWETTTEIDDTQWYRLTIKMIADIGTGKPGYVVFINGTKVRSANSISGTLTPAAAEWNATGSLFEGLTDSTEVKEVLFDGKGDVDEIAFTTNAPDFAKDAEFFTVTWDGTIASVTKGDDNVTQGQAFVVGSYDFVYTAAEGYISGSTNVTGVANVPATLTAAKLAATVTIDDVDTPVSSFADAVAAINDSQNGGTIKLADAATGDAMFTKATVLDLNGKVLTGNITANAALTIENSDASRIDGCKKFNGQIVGNVTMTAGALAVYGGYINGTIAPAGQTPGVAYGGQFNFEPGSFRAAMSIAPNLGLSPAKISTDPAIWEVGAFVAKIGDEPFTSLAEAIAALTGGETIVLLDNHTMPDEGVTFDKACTFDLGTKTLTVDGDANSNFFVTASVTFKNGTILEKNSGGRTLFVQDGATLNLTNITINATGGAPALDLLECTVNVYADTVITSQDDVFRCKEDNLTTAINIYGGTFTGATSDPGNDQGNSIFYNYKTDHVLNLTIADGQFTAWHIFSYNNKKDGGAVVNCELDDSCKAKFSTDATLSDYIKSGYKAEKQGDWYVIVEDSDEPVEPGEEVEVEAEDADKAAAAVEAKKANILTVPGTVKLEGDALTAYQNLFEAKAKETGTPGKYAVKFELTAAAEEAIKGELNQADGEQSILTPDEDGNATLVAKPGLFYGVAGADSLTLDSKDVKTWVQAESTTVKVKVPTVDGDKAFFKPICSAVVEK